MYGDDSTTVLSSRAVVQTGKENMDPDSACDTCDSGSRNKAEDII